MKQTKKLKKVIGSKGAYLIPNGNEAIIGFDCRKEVWVYDINKLFSIKDAGPILIPPPNCGRYPTLVDCFEVR